MINTMGGALVGTGVLLGAVVGQCGHLGHGAVDEGDGDGTGERQEASPGSQDSVAGDGAKM